MTTLLPVLTNNSEWRCFYPRTAQWNYDTNANYQYQNIPFNVDMDYPPLQVGSGKPTSIINLSSQRIYKVSFLSFLGYADTIPDNTEVGKLEINFADREPIEYPIMAGINTAEWSYDRPNNAVIPHKLPEIGYTFNNTIDCPYAYKGDVFYDEVSIDANHNVTSIQLLLNAGFSCAIVIPAISFLTVPPLDYKRMRPKMPQQEYMTYYNPLLGGKELYQGKRWVREDYVNDVYITITPNGLPDYVPPITVGTILFPNFTYREKLTSNVKAYVGAEYTWVSSPTFPHYSGDVDITTDINNVMVYTGSTYTVQPSDVGRYIGVRIRAVRPIDYVLSEWDWAFYYSAVNP